MASPRTNRVLRSGDVGLRAGTVTSHFFSSPIGKLFLLVTDVGVGALSFSGKEHAAALDRAMNVHGLRPRPRAAALPLLVRELERYFDGAPMRFSTPVVFLDGTRFQRRVWEALMDLPHGECRSYGWLAARIGSPRSARAIGQAVAANPVPILAPCHRIIASDGTIGGFSGGLRLKRSLLSIEGARLP